MSSDDVVVVPGARLTAEVEIVTTGPLSTATQTVPEAGASLAAPARYEILGEHGRGGLGRVSRAHDRALGRDVAIKEMLARGGAGEQRFMREALITARLEHPGIVPVHEAGRWADGTPFYAMKLVAGRPLRALIAERGTVEERIGLLHHVIAVADAIAYAHGRNVIHRDLKPANVIVGEFGETIVIDWGLAKDLGASDEPAASGDASPSPDAQLTRTGGVVGTPAYMAPEQARGEAVDRRADVFAIGAMLWELCALAKVPPRDRRLRHRLLRRGGIDRDLITIVDKCLDPDPARRYLDAGALAADLKAFKAGARIAARSYSLMAVLGHWARRHRRVAVAVAAVVVAAALGIVLYVRDVALERGRVEAAAQRLILENAASLLNTDPSAAYDLLQTYRGADAMRKAVLEAEAIGRGVARLRARPSTDAMFSVWGLPDDSVLAVGRNGEIVKAMPDGSSHVVSVERVAWPLSSIYVEKLHLFAYICDGVGLCLLDAMSEQSQASPDGADTLAPSDLSSSETGQTLAATSAHGDVIVWRLGNAGAWRVRYRGQLGASRGIWMIDDDTVFAADAHAGYLLRLNAQPPTVTKLDIADVMTLSIDPVSHHAFAGTADGSVVELDLVSGQIVRRVLACNGRVRRATPLQGGVVVYYCQSYRAGRWNPGSGTVVEFSDSVFLYSANAGDRYAYLGALDGRIIVYDSTTQLVTSHLGHSNMVSAVRAPSQLYPWLITSDFNGNLRTWSFVAPPINSAFVTGASLPDLRWLTTGDLLISGGGKVIWYSPATQAHGELPSQLPSAYMVATSPAGPLFALYGTDDTVEIWRLDGAWSRRSLKTGHGMVISVALTRDGQHALIGSRDGDVSIWSIDGAEHEMIGNLHARPIGMRVLLRSETVVIFDQRDEIWILEDHKLRYLGEETDRVGGMVTSPDERWLVIRTLEGNVRRYDVATGKSELLLHSSVPLTSLAISPDGRELAVATEHQLILRSFGASREDIAAPTSRGIDVQLYRPRRVEYSPDGKWLSILGERGDLWFYRRIDGRWIYLSVPGAWALGRCFSDDSAHFALTNDAGRLLMIDMTAALFR